MMERAAGRNARRKNAAVERTMMVALGRSGAGRGLLKADREPASRPVDPDFDTLTTTTYCLGSTFDAFGAIWPPPGIFPPPSSLCIVI